jgi:hypothetical protein
MNGAVSPLRAWASRGVTQPVAEAVPADDAQFLASKGELKIALRVAKRRCELAASGQRSLLAERIDPSWKRGVWFHAQAPQIGDALMDLAPRSLLAEHGIVLDLVAPPSIAALFQGDRWLGRVLGDPGQLGASGHDFAIVDNFAWRALAAKRSVVPRLPWVAVLGDYLAYDYQRALLATRRFAALLGVTLDRDAERRHARQKLQRRNEPAPLRDEPPRIALALGGVRPERTYRHWPDVARGLAAAGFARFTLLGSTNGAQMAAEVRAATAGADVLDLVCATDLNGAQQAMSRCALVLCADGGLLHLACTTSTPLVALFDASIDPAWRLPVDGDAVALRAGGRDVNGIAPATVVASALAALAATPLRPRAVLQAAR